MSRPTVAEPTAGKDGVRHAVLNLLIRDQGSEESCDQIQNLGQECRDQIQKLGEAAVPALISILLDEDLQLEDSPGGGWVPIHAVDLLATFNTEEAIEPMLKAFRTTESLTMMHDHLLRGLGGMGSQVLEPALRAYTNTDDDEYRLSLCCVLSRLGVHDDRIFDLLIRLLHQDVELGAMCLTEYGDDRAVPYLSDALNRQEIVADERSYANHVFVELRCGIVELGGELTKAQMEKCDKAMGPREGSPKLTTQPVGAQSTRCTDPKTKIGRNAPCWCGSGRKYKKCHWAQDQQA